MPTSDTVLQAHHSLFNSAILCALRCLRARDIASRCSTRAMATWRSFRRCNAFRCLTASSFVWGVRKQRVWAEPAPSLLASIGAMSRARISLNAMAESGRNRAVRPAQHLHRLVSRCHSGPTPGQLGTERPHQRKYRRPGRNWMRNGVTRNGGDRIVFKLESHVVVIFC